MQENRKQIHILIETLICAAISALCIWCGKYIFLTLIFIPFTGIFTYSKNGLKWLALLAVTGIAAAYFIDPMFIVPSVALLLVPALCTGTVVKNKIRSYRAVVISAAGWLAAAGIIIAYIYLTTGKEPLALIMEKVEKAMQEKDWLVSLAYGFVNSNSLLNAIATNNSEAFRAALSVTVEEMRRYVLSEDVLKIINNTVGVFIPIITIDVITAGGFISYVTGRKSAKKAGAEVAPIPAFDMLIIPAKDSIFFVLMYLLAAVPSLFNIETLLLAGNVLSGMLNVVFFIQGMSLINWLLKKKISNNGLSIFLAVLISTVLLSLVSMIGLFEQIIRIRDRARMRENDKNIR